MFVLQLPFGDDNCRGDGRWQADKRPKDPDQHDGDHDCPFGGPKMARAF